MLGIQINKIPPAQLDPGDGLVLAPAPAPYFPKGLERGHGRAGLARVAEEGYGFLYVFYHFVVGEVLVVLLVRDVLAVRVARRLES